MIGVLKEREVGGKVDDICRLTCSFLIPHFE